MRHLLALLAAGALVGCATTTIEDRADLLDRPIDCSVAQVDIAALEIAIPGTAERIASGVRLVVPAARIATRLRGQIADRREIAAGRTEDELRARIAEIQAACPAETAPEASP